MIANCLLVQTGGKNIVIDTGYGDKLTDKQKANFGYSAHMGLVAGASRGWDYRRTIFIW